MRSVHPAKPWAAGWLIATATGWGGLTQVGEALADFCFRAC